MVQQQSRVCSAVIGCSDDQPLERDFTYVGDIVNGTLAALFYEPRACGEVFNLGFGSPIRLLGMIDIMQQELGIAGKVVRYFCVLKRSCKVRCYASVSSKRYWIRLCSAKLLHEDRRRIVIFKDLVVVKAKNFQLRVSKTHNALFMLSRKSCRYHLQIC